MSVDDLRRRVGEHLREGHIAQAADCLRQLVQRGPRNADLHYDLGVLLARSGDTDGAAQAYRAAIALRTEHAPALNNLGNLLRNQGKLTESSAMLEASLRARPAHAPTLTNLGATLLEMGRIDEAVPHFARAAASGYAPANSNLLLTLNAHEGMTPDSLFREHAAFGRAFARPLPEQPAPHPRGKRLRLGYLSPDFRSHSVAFFIDGVLANHDRSRFEVTAYASVTRADAMTQRLRGHVEHWRDVAAMSDDAVAELIRRDRIDVLVDLAGHTDGTRLMVLARRPAPVQVSYLGYPNTTGMDAVDYLITDARVAPNGAERFYTEKLIRLPGPFFCYFAPELGVAPDRDPSRLVTFGVLTNWMKVRPIMMGLWAEVLRQVPDSRLILNARSLDDPGVREDTLEFFAKEGVATDRLQMIGWTDFVQYQRLLACVDVVLDTFPFNGHTTTCHALWIGAPVVTRIGQTHASRMGLSVLSALGLEELADQSDQNYVRIAVDLARDRQRLHDLQQSMPGRWAGSGLLDANRFTRELEAVYEQLVAPGSALR